MKSVTYARFWRQIIEGYWERSVQESLVLQDGPDDVNH